MKSKTKWAIAAILLILAYGLAVIWFWRSLPQPYEKPPGLSKSEEQLMERARKRYGNYTQIIAVGGIYMERKGRNGKQERVWVVKRGGEK